MEFDDLFRQVQGAKYDCLLFDLDDTLYPQSSGLAAACGKNIRDYMVDRLGIDEGKIIELSNLLYKNYGTTMAGLRAIGYEFDYDEYHSFVHGRLPYENLKPDHVLRNLLLSLPIQKLIFTNADRVHATIVLNRLGLEDCFEGIICFETLNPTKEEFPLVQCISDGRVKPASGANIFDVFSHFSQSSGVSVLPKTPILCKPSEDAIKEALNVANLDPRRTFFFDDSVRNIQAGKQVGLHTVLVGTSYKVKGADFALESIHNMREALPELWEDSEKVDGVRYPSEVAIETSVTA